MALLVQRFPDVSSYQDGLQLQPGTVAVIIKATEGTAFTDPNYTDFCAQADRIGAVDSAYHYLHQGNGAAQADHAYAVVGPRRPLMLDVEPIRKIGSRPTVADARDFITRYRARGGRVWASYFPRWYWQEIGGNLASLDTPVIASGYPSTGYADNDPNWQPYGGITPVIWQYTDEQSYGGKLVDYNAFRGTAAQLKTLIRGDIPTSGAPAPTTPIPEDDMTALTIDTGEIPKDLDGHMILMPPADVGQWGDVWISFACDFVDGLTLRVAAWIDGQGWEIHEAVPIPREGGRVNPWGGPAPAKIQKISVKRSTALGSVGYLVEARPR